MNRTMCSETVYNLPGTSVPFIRLFNPPGHSGSFRGDAPFKSWIGYRSEIER